MTAYLNRVCAEPESLFAYKGAVLRFTCNFQNKLHQGQLCIVSGFDVNNQSVTIKTAPPGYNLDLPDVDFLTCPEVAIKKHVGMLYKFNS